MALEHHLVLATDQVRIDQRQAGLLHALAHHLLALITLADVEGRGIDDRQQLRPGFLGQAGGLLKPRVLANQQADADARAFGTGLKHTHAVAGREVAPLIKHLVIGQFALGIGRHHLALAQHAGRVSPPVG